jgi:chemotaxis protein CheX
MTCETEPVTRAEIGAAIRQATTEVFSVMLGMDLDAGDDQEAPPEADHSGVVAVLGLTGAWGGSGELSCDGPLALEIARRLLMSECTAVDEEVLDAIAEVTNMIVGNVKTCLEQNLGPMGMSTPAVFFGADFETRVVGRTTKVRVAFLDAAGSLTVQVAIAPMARTRLRSRV